MYIASKCCSVKGPRGRGKSLKIQIISMQNKKVPLQPDSGKMQENDRKSDRKQLILLTVEFVYVLTGTGI